MPVLLQAWVCRNMPRGRTDGWQGQQVRRAQPRELVYRPINRFILANTEQLHEKIKTMSERIRRLEEALQSSHSQLSAADHPLLRPNLLLIKKSPELFGIDQQQLAVHSESPPDGEPRHDERTVTAEDLRAGSASSREGDEVSVRDEFEAVAWLTMAGAVCDLHGRADRQRTVQAGGRARGTG